jgi:hypothetical protein
MGKGHYLRRGASTEIRHEFLRRKAYQFLRRLNSDGKFDLCVSKISNHEKIQKEFGKICRSLMNVSVSKNIAFFFFIRVQLQPSLNRNEHSLPAHLQDGC